MSVFEKVRATLGTYSDTDVRSLLHADHVKIRELGDFAIIHAATSYTTADGQQAHGRYTDCWAKQNGKWLAVSAHVSR